MNVFALQHIRRHADDPTGFLDQAIFLARASELAYGDDAQRIAQSLGLSSVNVFPDATLRPMPNTQGFWFHHGRVAALVFRGSANRAHWLSNFKVLPPEQVNHPWGTAHPGFLASLALVIDTVLRPFAAAAKGADIVWLSGHSLGGALAVLAAAWLRNERGLKPALLTFGQPMPGFDDFCQRFDVELPGRLTRLINQSDFVPRVPGFGYAHCGQPKTITAGLRLERLSQTGVAPLALADVEPAPATQAEFEAFLYQLETAPLTAAEDAQLEGMITKRIPWTADHGCDRYVANLQAIRQGLSSGSTSVGPSVGSASPS